MINRYLFPVLFLILFGPNLNAQEYSPAINKTDSLLSAFVRQANISGLSVAVSKVDVIIYKNTFGYADIEAKSAISDTTLFRIGSVTKLFTAVTFCKLLEEGVLSENATVGMYINNLPDAISNITLAQLASHTSGIRHYSRDEIMGNDFKQYSKLEEGLSRFINDTLLFKPGEKYSYSSYGYILLGAVMENVLQMSFNNIIKKYILIPAAMNRTFPETMETVMFEKANFYYRSGNGFENAAGKNYSYKWPAGGYLSTPVDLVKFGNALLSGKLVTEASRQLLFTSKQTNSGKQTGTGYGFRIAEDYKGRKVVHHGGESEGARAFLLIYPEKKLCISFCANVFRAPLFEGEAETVAGYFLNDYEYSKNLLQKGKYKYITTIDKKDASGEIMIDEYSFIKDFIDSDIPVVDIVWRQRSVQNNFYFIKRNDKFLADKRWIRI